MKSVRLDEALEARLREVSRITGEPMSVIMRQAIQSYCDAVLDQRLDRRLADVIGIFHGGGGRAERTGDAFRKVLQERREKVREDDADGCRPAGGDHLEIGP